MYTRRLWLLVAIVALGCVFGKKTKTPEVVLTPPSSEPAAPVQQPGFALAFSPRGDAAARLRAGELSYWADLGAEPVSLPLSDEEKTAGALSIAPGLLALGLSTGRVLTRAIPGDRAQVLRADGPAVVALALSQDGKTLLVNGADNTIEVWDLSSRAKRHALSGHAAKVSALALSQDGNTGLSAAEDRAVFVWDLRTGEQRASLSGHSRPVWSAALSQDGTRALTASGDGSLRGWEIPSGRERFFRLGLSWAIAARADDARAVALQAGQLLLLETPSGLALGSTPRLDNASEPPRAAAFWGANVVYFSAAGELFRVETISETMPLPWTP